MAGLGKDSYTKLYRSFLASRGKGGAALGLSILFFENPDAVDPNSKTAVSHLSERTEMTGLQRLKLMYSYDVYGNLSPELSMVIQSGLMGVFMGTVIGGTMHSKESYLSFIERNQGTAFQNIKEAQKELQNKVTVGFGRGAWMVGWRLGLFCSTFMLFTNSIAAYRGSSSVIEYSVGGFLTGAIYKFKLGPRASLAGGLVGGLLGTVAGIANTGILYLTGTSTDQLRKFHYEWQESRQEERLRQIYTARDKDLDVLSLEHGTKLTKTHDPLAGIDTTEATTTKQ
ncbi:RPII140-upstream gene protein-like [Portunus trituberculatus]|uniref:Complex I assembly factor TIMMDC1, mitochondrial n=1 Tax=Portunus trituberculatus TaxID=210409 RepID=A0A5B7DNQ9_PORTR|nr:RPII140-upstream gene protein-like [Portunus trituberculatus]MPC23252.1 RPII140-upstream gene protein [Portunus trituberculatus]